MILSVPCSLKTELLLAGISHCHCLHAWPKVLHSCEMFLWDLVAVLYDINKRLQFFEVFERLRFLAFVILCH